MSGPRIVPRSEWGAQYGDGNDVSANLPWGEAVMHTEAGAVRKQDWEALANGPALVATTEAQHMRNVERFHAVTRGWDGVGYSFFIMFDGTIFEGRGWGRSGAHTEGRNSTAAGICFQGHGDLQEATEAQWASARWLIGEGVRLGHLKPNPRIGSHHEYSQKGKTCCGLKIRPHLSRLHGITGPTPEPPKDDDMFTDEDRRKLDEVYDQIATSRDSKAKGGPTLRWLVTTGKSATSRVLARLGTKG